MPAKAILSLRFEDSKPSLSFPAKTFGHRIVSPTQLNELTEVQQDIVFFYHLNIASAIAQLVETFMRSELVALSNQLA